MLKLRESMLTGAFGAFCLASLVARRPAMFYVGRSFATGGDKSRHAEFDEIWEQPGAARKFRVVTAVWGVGLVGEAALRTVLAVTISTQHFLETGPFVGWIVLGGLIWYSTTVLRAGERDARLTYSPTPPSE